MSKYINVEKQLLLKDLCSRLPYDLYVRWCDDTIENISQKLHCLPIAVIENAKMFLRPMSSMTEEESNKLGDVMFNFINSETYYTDKQIDWLNAHHFDYRGLIEKGLAMEAPADMYK